MSDSRKTILVVEDETTVLRVVRAALDREGYRVLGAGSPLEAERVFEQERGHVDLLLADVRLGDASGSDVARTLRQRTPSLKVVLTSGGDLPELEHQLAAVPDAGFIQKPYSLGRLAETIRKALAEPPDAD